MTSNKVENVGYSFTAGKGWEIKCAVCKKPFLWEPPEPTEIPAVRASKAKNETPILVTFSKTCPNRIDPVVVGGSPDDCLTQWSIEYDFAENKITRIRLSSSPTTDKVWIEFAIKRALKR